MVQRTSLLRAVLALLLLSTVVSAAADRAISDTESRRRGAESSLREIIAKQSPALQEARKSYDNAAVKQNAWLDSVIEAVERRAVAEPDVTAITQSATAALMDWVAVGGKGLGLPALSESMEKGLRKTVEKDLADIAKDTWKTNLNADVKKRDEAVASLNTRLRWKSADEVAKLSQPDKSDDR